MSFLAYLKNRFLLLLLQFVCICLLGTFLYLTGYELAKFWLILIVWLLVLFVWMITNWLDRRAYFRKSQKLLQELDQRYLLGELLPQSWHLEDRLYQEMIRKSNKAVIERIHQLEAENRGMKV